MIDNLNLFYIVDKLIQTNVKFGNSIQVTVLGKGTIGIPTKQGEQNTMHDVYYVKGLEHNLMSIGKMT